MDGKQHRVIAPIFTVLSTIIASKSGIIDTANIYTTLAVATPLSVLFANAPDADLYASYPVKVILGKSGKQYATKRYNKRTEKKELKKYNSPKGPINKMFALLFKSLGVKKHRDWRSHSPLIYIPLGILAIKLINKIPEPTGVLLGVVLGTVFSFWSHLFADMPNKGGLEYFPGGGSKGIKNITPKFMHNWFRSGGKFMYAIVIASMIEIFLFLLSKDLAVKINTGAYTIIKGIVMNIVNIILSFIKLITGSGRN